MVAASTVAPPARGGTGIRAISAAKIEVIAARAVGIFGIVFGLQCLPIMFRQLPDLDRGWADAVNLAVFGGLILVAVASVFNRFVRLATSWVAIAYLGALLVWPLTVVDTAPFATQASWLWFLCTVATACAAVAFPVVWAAAYTVIVPVVYGALRTLPSGGSADTALAALDALYAIMLGLVVLIIITMLRQAASAVDVAQIAALSSYTTAVRQHATELERIEVDAIVHDSVLTTLLSAANARTDADGELAARMAREAIAKVDAASSVLPGSDRAVPVAHLERRLRAAVAGFSAPVSVSVGPLLGHTLPAQAAEALYSAAVQALVNSLQHAGGNGSEQALRRPVRRSLTMHVDASGMVRLAIADSGVGFDVDATPAARIGVRVSILERISSVGGVARVQSARGAGTTIVLAWPAPSEGGQA
ncbi:sensor histidine kinase [Microterricola pindariensis]|uniref:ATP-binding protein n=1 Tax=Microterricola pindariensis TaxID=478010 RepID=A0ABX5AX45_9MICO|nr:ATP-binding protein [Microterricola pindariensis]PPL19498.1 hypothetical protein GY24_05425 [Microterricola pindariensis]